MPAVNENSKLRSRRVAIVFAFLMTCIVHSIMILVAARTLNDVGAIAWDLQWTDASILGVIAVTWRVWFRSRN